MGASVTRSETVLDRYEATDLGAPFRVLLFNSVRQVIDDVSGDVVETIIPNMRDLLKRIAASRVLNNRKLTGKDIKFVRKALPLRAIELAKQLSIGPEHLSRCEAGEAVMSDTTEKYLRTLVFLDAFELSESTKGLDSSNKNLRNSIEKYKALLNATKTTIANMKIVSVHDPESELVFAFSLSPVEQGSKSQNTDIDQSWDDAKAA